MPLKLDQNQVINKLIYQLHGAVSFLRR